MSKEKGYNNQSNRILVYAFPFSYNGPCATLAGAGHIYNRLKDIYKENNTVVLKIANQHFTESPHAYLLSIFERLHCDKFTKVICLGGNHLTSLPIHAYAKETNLVSIILDAHRDFNIKSGNSINHSNFLNFLPDLMDTCIWGYRDGNEESYKGCNSYRVKEKRALFRKIDDYIEEKRQFYLDVDIDVLDPEIFPAVSCPINDGVSVTDLMQMTSYIGLGNIDVISISEFVPLLDDGKCEEMIVTFIKTIIEGWLGNE